MPSLSERHRNNVKAGLFVSVSLLLGLAVIVVLGDVFENLSRTVDKYTVTFDVKTGVGNLKEGSDVRVGGVKQGKVLEVDAIPEPGQPLRTIEVKFELNDKIKLYSDVTVLVMAPLIGADGWLEIPDVGRSNEQLPPGSVITGVSTSALLTGLIGAEKAEMLDSIFADAKATMANARHSTDNLPNLAHEYDTRIVPTLDKFNSAVTKADEFVTDFQQNKWPQWSQAVSLALDNAVSGTDSFKTILADNKPRIDNFMIDAESAVHTIREETIVKANEFLDKGNESLESVRSVLNELRADYSGWATNIADALASVNLAGQQLKLATIEIRHSPWKLLYRPEPKEEEFELLYDATRNFALAAGDLKSASESVRRIIDQSAGAPGGAPMQLDQATVERLQKHLLDSLSRYETAQQQLMDVLLTAPPSPK